MRPFIVVAALLASTAVFAQQKSTVPAGKADAVIKAAFPGAPEEFIPRLSQDETMKQCSASHNNPTKAIADEIQKREKATIEYPADGKFLGDWKKGEALAQSGYGLRFTDYPARRPNGGNCYACHQISKQEVSYGTLGPSLYQYGKLRNFAEADVKATYEKIYNSHSALPCSNMPRFGANKVLTIDQIKDAVALLMSPDSPANKD
ncbi:sulfur oxidation c-type cytochrome SoxX [Pseudorhodoplanes sinuspersici]|uniref:Sulfur oxidation c-type cytochrome SoxX n=2 Tax=Pseudorhodoplanes sinuspersici TaxID=1235591 RepID=A0A1W7A145_9HYPH|nr:sulfur oxidation c-type cytochrome SoxX [Pseudorhodoplanes sinuspersici]